MAVNAGNIHSGSVQATAVNLTALADLDVAANARLQAADEITLDSGNNLSVAGGTVLQAGGDIVLTAGGNLLIGTDSAGAFICAGQIQAPVDLWSTSEPLRAQYVTGSGAVLFDTYRDGSGQGDISIGSGARIMASGNKGHPGTIALLSAADIQLSSDVRLLAVGGDLWLSAADDIEVQAGTNLSSIAVTHDTGGQGSGGLLEHTGGRVGVLAGAIQTNMSVLLNGLSVGRTASNSISLPAGAAWGSGNTINASGGSVMQVVFPSSASKSVTNSTFRLAGGVIFLDPPDAGNSVSINGAVIRAVGPAISAAAQLPAPAVLRGAAPEAASRSVPVTPSPGLSNHSLAGSSVIGKDTLSGTTKTSAESSVAEFPSAAGMAFSGDTVDGGDALPNMRQAVFCHRSGTVGTKITT